MTKGYKGVGMEGSIARWYATNTGKDLWRYEEQAKRVVEQAPAGAHILEVAPGPGYLSIALARTGSYAVTALEISQTFVDIARQKAADAGVTVHFQLGDAGAMPFDDGSFDFIICCAAFKNFADPVGALNEMHRVLRPGGRALVIDLRHNPSKEAVAEDVAHMDMGPFNRWFTTLSLRTFLSRRAHTRAALETFVAQTPFTAEIREAPMTMELELVR
ncbi:class I SAM-dependent methyltransferase [Nonomuraea sp. NBC_01738]|uniref:class I SAM-dependent methyltransferase n=1 Tax=Nonomuraea sp. NBC_01738 TaxID=2976003 RepID=UPI002E14C216|nr:class I SAM-dependent methyltransferase [Nonomuraea sp. NBC_01738]